MSRSSEPRLDFQWVAQTFSVSNVLNEVFLLEAQTRQVESYNITLPFIEASFEPSHLFSPCFISWVQLLVSLPTPGNTAEGRRV